MPELIITAGSDMRPVNSILEMDDWSYITLYGRMMFPGDNEKFEEWCYINSADPKFDEFIQRSLAEILSGERESAPDPNEYPSFRMAKKHVARLSKAFTKGHRAGEALYVLRRIFAHPTNVRGRDPSLYQAYAVAAANHGVSSRSVRIAWENYKQVAHLWAAHAALNILKPGQLWRSKEFCQNQLIISEAFLDFFEGHKTGRGKSAKPVLSRQKAFHLPENSGIDDEMREAARSLIELIPPLVESEVLVLRAYKASERHKPSERQ